MSQEQKSELSLNQFINIEFHKCYDWCNDIFIWLVRIDRRLDKTLYTARRNGFIDFN